MNTSKVGYNEAWVKSVSYQEFAKHNEHLKHLTDLKADYERITGKKVEAENTASEKPKGKNKQG